MAVHPSIPGNVPACYSPDDYAAIRELCARLSLLRNQGDLGSAIAQVLQRYTIFDLQVICGRLHHEVDRLPSPYREAVRPYFVDQVFGPHHQVLLMQRNRAFPRMNDPVRDPALLDEFLRMIPDACFQRENHPQYIPEFNSPYQGLFYYLMAVFSMFVLEVPGHPVGMPFPGGFRVEKQGQTFTCPVRDKEREVPHSICNFCPAKQSEVPSAS